MEFDADDSIFRYITWMFIGIVAFGFGILYMNRLGEISTLYEIQQESQEIVVESKNDLDKALTEVSKEIGIIDIDVNE